MTILANIIPGQCHWPCVNSAVDLKGDRQVGRNGVEFTGRRCQRPIPDLLMYDRTV
jgi:hypothetical protein